MSLWTKEEDAILKAHFAEHGSSWEGWESLLPDRTDNAIYRHAASMGLTMKSRPRVHKSNDGMTGRAVIKKSKDPYEGYVLACLERGMTPSEIDASMKWRPGKARLIITERWERMNA